MTVRDRREKRTEKLLHDALIAVSLERGYDQVTIKDITDRADIAYSTFFRHYHDKDELLLGMLEQVLETLRIEIDAHPVAQKETSGLLLFGHVARNAAFYRVVFSSQGTGPVLSRFRETVERELLSWNPARLRPHAASVPPELIVHHLVVSIIAMVQWWLRHDMPYSIEEMARFYSVLIMQPLEAFWVMG